MMYEFTKYLQNEGFVKKENGQILDLAKEKEKEKMIQDQIKIPDLWDFSLRKEAMYPRRIIIHSFPYKRPTISTVFRRKNNTATDSVASLPIFHCILDD